MRMAMYSPSYLKGCRKPGLSVFKMQKLRSMGFYFQLEISKTEVKSVVGSKS